MNTITQTKTGLVDCFVKSLFDPRFYFTIALFSGEAGPEVFRSSGWMYILTAFGLVLMFVNRRVSYRNKKSIVLLIYAIVIIRNISLNSDVLYLYEIPNIVTVLLLFFIKSFFYKEEDIDAIEGYLFFYSCVLAFLGVFTFVRNPTERLAVFGGPNGYYKIALLFEVLCFHNYLLGKGRLYQIGMVLGIILCVATGSKGGIASMAIILVFEVSFFLFNSGERRGLLIKRIINISSILIVGFIVIAFVIKRIPGLSIMFERANVLLGSKDLSNLTSVSARMDLIDLGIRFFKESPIIGKGARYTYFYTNGEQPYSHNIFVEFLSENGIVATVPLVYFMLRVMVITLKNGLKDSFLFCIFLCFVVYLSGSLFSGNILDAKPVFVFGILLFNHVSNKIMDKEDGLSCAI